MLEHGQNIELVNGWRNSSAGAYGDPRVDIAGGLVNLRGLVDGSNARADRISTLPVGLRPAQRLIFPTHYSRDTGRVDVLPDGGIIALTFSRTTTQNVNLSNIRFTIDAGEPLALQPDWEAFSREYGYRPPSALVIDGRVVDLSGLARFVGEEGEGGEVIAVLPEEMRPPRNLVFNVTITDGSSVRVDVNSDGRIVYLPARESSVSDRFVSLSGIRYSLADGERLELLGNSVGEVTYNHADGIVRLAGLVGNLPFLIVRLPGGARPTQIGIFGVRSQDRVVNVKVSPDGLVQVIQPDDWVSLTGIEFALPQGVPKKLPVGT
jgi:antitoxin component of MazEF toxin-antitoxin module